MLRVDALCACVAVIGISLSAAAAPMTGAGDNVIVVTPISVDVPPNLPGDCRVTAKVLEVMAGSAFKPGQTTSIKVPCSNRAPVFDDRPASRTTRGGELDPVVLRHSTRGFVHLDDSGRLIWTAAARPYAPYGVAFGYRVLDGVKVPVRAHSIA
jgi:hypothetical protein